MTDLQGLLAAKQAADQALADHETGLLDELVAAKAAHRTQPGDETRARKAAAVAAIQAHRAAIREGRGHTPTIGGDAFLSPDQNGG